MENINKIFKFITEAEKLKCIKRHNYTLDNMRQENSAEHSWHAALMAIFLFDKENPKLDQLKVIKMLIIHDLVEIYAEDAFLYDEKKRLEAVEKEKNSMEKLLKLLPNESGEELKELWYEFENGKTENAKFARSLDGLQPLLNHLVAKEKGFNPDNISVKQVYKKKSYINEFYPKLWPITDRIIKAGLNKGLFRA